MTQNFDIDLSRDNDQGELEMQVSSICQKDGKKFAYVTFSDGKRFAEGEIPACTIVRTDGFTPKEVAGLELYLRQNLDMLKSMAAAINPIKAMMK